MERIIIQEIDNTSNVESLSSYDVVYVPGFSNAVQDKPLFRVPTLVTSKYQFLNLFGDSVPTFDYDQPYPVASSTTSGFPSYAIPNFSNLIVDSNPVELINFDDFDILDQYYMKVSVVPDDGDADWSPDPDTTYFLVTGFTDNWEVQYSTLPLGTKYVLLDSEPSDWETNWTNYYTFNSSTGEYEPLTDISAPTFEVDTYYKATQATYVETYGEEGSNNVYISRVNPRELNWYEYGTGDVPFLTGDTQISANLTGTATKNYYQATQSTPPMFYANEADPGYRYALYLLSLGIPVYYEQMNSPDFTQLNLVTDWSSSLAQYGTSEEIDGSTIRYISPYIQGWYYRDGASYKRCTDESIKYIESADLGDDVWYSGADISLDSMYIGLEKRFMADPEAPDYSFDSIGDYSIKYISSGGYPTFEYGKFEENSLSDGLAYSMIHLAFTRGDAVALIDHTNNPDRSIYESEQLSVIYKVREKMADYDGVVASYGAMFTPWYTCTHSAISGGSGANYSTFMPASLAFLSALSIQLKNYNPWLAVSGVTRGKIPYFGSLHTNYVLTNNVADSYQTVPTDEVSDYALISINPITYIRQYGYCIWGNRTLRNNKSGTKASSFLNIRNLVSDIKKRLYEASQQLLFEQNTDLLWINFKSLITPLLDTMVSNNILSDYQLTKYNIDPDSGDPVPAYMVLANIRIRPINSVEVFDLTVQLENNEIAVAEVQ